MHKITMLGAGLIGSFYTMTLHGHRSKDHVQVICAKDMNAAKQFAEKFDVPKYTTNMDEAINDPETDVVVIGIPNYLHKEAVLKAIKAKKAVLCTKPLGRTAAEAKEMLEAAEKAGVFCGYLEDLVYTPKTLKSMEAVKAGALGKILWVRSRETHPGPHSDWFWDKAQSGGGAIVDMGCHCIEIARNFIGKDIRPVEVMCWGATQVHPIEAEDSAIGLVRYENGAIGQFEVSWTFRGGMDLRDEVSGTEGTIWLNHWLRTGIEMFTAVGQGGYVAEKMEGDTGWLYPVGDEVGALGYVDMMGDMLDSLDKGKAPLETFYDGYIVNSIIDSAYRSIESKKWEPVNLEIWGGRVGVEDLAKQVMYDEDHSLVKEEKMPDGKTKLILKNIKTGQIEQKFLD
ncbi:MAG: Gfo/Idh/MocA family oxidoreductase [Anaerolineaceae bacterium]|nr:Gfo/Idh/MocA family oxidoreductase [Anaerolineaceae bacterium]